MTVGAGPASPDASATAVDAAAGQLPYQVLVGDGALRQLASLVRGVNAARWTVIADATASGHYGAAVQAALTDAAGAPALLLTVDPGEHQKTRQTWADLTDAMLAAGCGRDSAVLALGGGVVGDLAGFVAATYMRGLPFVQAPTTLLAMVDASVGGKVGVDTPAGKNLVGAFHPPALVVIDPTVLATLPRVEIRAGAVEALKHGVIASPAHFDDAARVLADPAPRVSAEFVRASVAIKAGVVAQDPHERGLRHVLNFGHTVGHAAEFLMNYHIRHGWAVSIGMVVESAAAELAGIAEPGTTARIRAALDAGDQPTHALPGLTPPEVFEAARRDKKTRRGELRYAVPVRIGEMAEGDGQWTVPLPDAVVRDALLTA